MIDSIMILSNIPNLTHWMLHLKMLNLTYDLSGLYRNYTDK